MRTPPIFNWGNRIGNAPPNVTDFGCCFTLNRVQNVTISLTKVMGRHTAKAGFYIDDSYKPQSAGVGATGSYRGTVSFGNDANNPLDSGVRLRERRARDLLLLPAGQPLPRGQLRLQQHRVVSCRTTGR